MSYTVFKLMHLLGVVLLLGNIIVTAAWKLAADRHGNPAVVAFAQRMVALTDFAFTLPGVALTLVGAHGMGWLGGFSLWQPGWIAWGHALFIVSLEAAVNSSSLRQGLPAFRRGPTTV